MKTVETTDPFVAAKVLAARDNLMLRIAEKRVANLKITDAQPASQSKTLRQ